MVADAIWRFEVRLRYSNHVQYAESYIATQLNI